MLLEKHTRLLKIVLQLITFHFVKEHLIVKIRNLLS